MQPRQWPYLVHMCLYNKYCLLMAIEWLKEMRIVHMMPVNKVLTHVFLSWLQL